ncbi:MAG: DUF4159 domain-containing protein [Bryobacteraceae bacterium]|nr:DUF4159 domain-containing protein [Bryobacteraceae bacterium]
MGRRWIFAVAVVLLGASLTYAWQRRGMRGGFFDFEDNPAAIPADASEKTEFYWARLRYQDFRGWGGRRGFGRSWTTDYPKNDRLLLQAVRRLTRIHARSMEHVVDLESDDLFNYPFLYAVEVGHWDLSDAEAKKLREYLDRGGFLMVDDFHGTLEWQVFMMGLSKVFPDRPVVDIEDKDAIFHVLYDLDQRVQIPGIAALWNGVTYERDGVVPRWRAVYDDKGRIVVAICHNMDLGDAWEWADRPEYPEHYASLAFRIAINYIIYAMTH